jgi:predicted nucleotide-binding protein
MLNRKLFIGCSREAIGIAQHLEVELNTLFHKIDIVIWDKKKNWRNAKSTLESLMLITNEFYYSIFIFHPDDYIKLKGKEFWITRDNVLFEAGLFFSKMGGERTFILKPTLLTGHPDNNEFRVLNDIDGIEFTNYKIDYNSVDDKWNIDLTDNYTKTNIKSIFTDLQKKEDELNITFDQSTNELSRVLKNLESDLKKINENDEFYLSAFFKNFENLLRFKAIQISKAINHILIDIAISVKKIDDILDISQLAEEQSKKFNPDLETVWVFANEPLEFKALSAKDPLKKHFDRLRKTIIENLKSDVKYVYFVNNDFNLDNLTSLVGNEQNLLNNIEIIRCDKKHFISFFTLHFEAHQQNPSEIYVSFIDRDRDDLLIKVPNSSQIKGIHENLCSIRGKSEITTTYNVFDRTS